MAAESSGGVRVLGSAARAAVAAAGSVATDDDESSGAGGDESGATAGEGGRGLASGSLSRGSTKVAEAP